MEISIENSTLFQRYINNNVTYASTLDPVFWISSAAVFILDVFSLPLNTWVLCLILRNTGVRVSSDIFVLNLSAMDVVYCLVCPLYWFLISFTNLKFLPVLCFSNGFILAGQPLFQCCIYIEQYLAVVHPITYLKYKPVRYRVMCSGAVWLLATGWGTLCMSDFLFTIYTSSCICVAVLAVYLFCSFSILKALRRPGPGEGEREGMNLMKKRASTIVVIIQLLMVVNYIPMPLVIIGYLKGFVPDKDFLIGYSVTYFLFMSGSFVQPLLYLTRAGKLQCLH